MSSSIGTFFPTKHDCFWYHINVSCSILRNISDVPQTFTGSHVSIAVSLLLLLPMARSVSLTSPCHRGYTSGEGAEGFLSLWMIPCTCSGSLDGSVRILVSLLIWRTGIRATKNKRDARNTGLHNECWTMHYFHNSIHNLVVSVHSHLVNSICPFSPC